MFIQLGKSAIQQKAQLETDYISHMSEKGFLAADSSQ